MGRVGSCFDNAAAEAFFHCLEWEVLSLHDFGNTGQTAGCCYGSHNHQARTVRRA